MKRTTRLERKTPLKRTGAPKRKRKPLKVSQRIKQEGWHQGVRGKVCAVCGDERCQPVEAHHILRVQVLERESIARGFDFDRARWDHRNRLPAGNPCHGGHHSRARPITRAVLRKHAPKVFQFARELGLEHVLEREYPDINPKGASA